MLVYLDEGAFAARVQPECTIRGLLDEVRAALQGTGRMVMNIRADGLEIADADYDATLGKSVGTFARYDFTSADPREVVAAAMAEALDLLARADVERTRAIELFTKGTANAAMEHLGNCCRAWHQVHQALSNAIGLLHIDAEALVLPTGALVTSLNSIQQQFNEMRTALQAQDFVLVSDILQYEFDAVLGNWKDAIHAVAQTAAQEAPCV